MGSASALSTSLRAGSGSKRNSITGERVVVRPTLTDQPCLDRSVCLGRALYDLGSSDMSCCLSSGRVWLRPLGGRLDGWSGERGAGLGVGVASLMMRGLGTPGPGFVLAACAV
jgi:hypothetical protein